MAATRGPVPKRSDQRRRTNKPDTPVKTLPRQAKVGGTYTVPLAMGHWHPLAKDFWQALRKSDQTALYQPSDWEYARIQFEMLSRQLESDKPSAMMLATIDSAMARLLVTEGDRRRMRIELERAGKADPDRDAGVASMNAWRQKLAGGGS